MFLYLRVLTFLRLLYYYISVSLFTFFFVPLSFSFLYLFRKSLSLVVLINIFCKSVPTSLYSLYHSLFLSLSLFLFLSLSLSLFIQLTSKLFLFLSSTFSFPASVHFFIFSAFHLLQVSQSLFRRLPSILVTVFIQSELRYWQLLCSFTLLCSRPFTKVRHWDPKERKKWGKELVSGQLLSSSNEWIKPSSGCCLIKFLGWRQLDKF